VKVGDTLLCECNGWLCLFAESVTPVSTIFRATKAEQYLEDVIHLLGLWSSSLLVFLPWRVWEVGRFFHREKIHAVGVLRKMSWWSARLGTTDLVYIRATMNCLMITVKR
jgi:hypothetical protein